MLCLRVGRCLLFDEALEAKSNRSAARRYWSSKLRPTPFLDDTAQVRQSWLLYR